MRQVLSAAVLLLAVLTHAVPVSGGDSPPLPGGDRFRALRQLTFGGQNAEAYFSFDETRLIFQSTRDGTRLVFASNRNGTVPGETNLFLADWVDPLPRR